jgi:putative two-component system response regulator
MSRDDHGPSPGARLLVADDDPAVRRLLRVRLEREGFAVTEAPDGAAALEQIAEADFDLMLFDVRMPAPDGLELTRLVRLDPKTALTPVILITGLGSLEDKVAGLDAGATDFLTKPFEAPELLARIRSSLRVATAIQRLETTQTVLVALANTIEAKDAQTSHHCNRLASMSVGLATRVGLDADAIESLGYAAALHDIGKIAVPESILRKPGPLTEEEWVEVRRHPAVGAKIVAALRVGPVVGPIIRGHHEHWDGRGYPDGLRREAIPPGARIVAIADAFDAMTSDRPYRPARTVAAAVREIRLGAGRQFDPKLSKPFLEMIAEQPGRTPTVAPYARGLMTPRLGW